MNAVLGFELLVKHFPHKMPLGSVYFELESDFSIDRQLYAPPSFSEMISGNQKEVKFDLYILSAAQKHRILRFTETGVIPSWPVGVNVDRVIPFEKLKRIAVA